MDGPVLHKVMLLIISIKTRHQVQQVIITLKLLVLCMKD
jgi:hypothetical protein